MLVLKLFHGPLSLIFKFYYYRGKWLWLCLRQTYKVTSYFNDREYVTQFSCQLSTSMSKSPSALSKWFSKIIYIYIYLTSAKNYHLTHRRYLVLSSLYILPKTRYLVSIIALYICYRGIISTYPLCQEICFCLEFQ